MGKKNRGKNIGYTINEENRIYNLKKEKNYVSEKDPQCEYNKFTREFLNENPDFSGKEDKRF